MREAQAMGYRFAIFPGVRLREVIPGLDTALRTLKPTQRAADAPPGARRPGAGAWVAAAVTGAIADVWRI